MKQTKSMLVWCWMSGAAGLALGYLDIQLWAGALPQVFFPGQVRSPVPGLPLAAVLGSVMCAAALMAARGAFLHQSLSWQRRLIVCTVLASWISLIALALSFCAHLWVRREILKQAQTISIGARLDIPYPLGLWNRILYEEGVGWYYIGE
jgi:hypothetical protein